MKKILIVDDEIDICEMMRDFLENRGYEVVYSITGQGGIDAFTVVKPDIVMLDICLTDISGLEVLKNIRVMDKTCVIIIITGSAVEDDRKKAMDLKANYYFNKPLSIAKLQRLLSKL